MGQAIATRTCPHGKEHTNRRVLYSAEEHLEDLRVEEHSVLLEMQFQNPGSCWVDQEAGISCLRQA